MSNFDLRKFLTENKLTSNSKPVKEEYGYDDFHQAVDDIFDESDPRHEELSKIVDDAHYEGELEHRPWEINSHYAQVMALARQHGLVDETTEESTTEEVAEDQVEEVGEENSVGKYLKLETADDIIREIEFDIRKDTFEAKMKKLKEVIEAMNGKLTSLEEDSNLEGFVNTSKLKEMKRTLKKLRSIDEKYMKEYDKKYKKD